MNDGPARVMKQGARPAFGRVMIVLAGIIAGQVLLYGPSLAGRKILLPLDILTLPSIYSPSAAGAPPAARDGTKSDLVFLSEPTRRFVASELRAKRLPQWNPYQYAGVPFSGPKFSPFLLLAAAFESPRGLPWIEILAALVSGLGAYAFFRRALRIAFWPAAITAWCYPLSAFFILWQGYGLGLSVVWLPWLLLSVHETVPGGRWPALGLAVVTFLTLVSGKLDIATQALIVSGIYALWRYRHVYRGRRLRWSAVNAGGALLLGWGLGFMLAAPELLPMMAYAKTGMRMHQRAAGQEDRPPVGLAALPQIVFPDIYGSTDRGSMILPSFGKAPNLPESPAAAYAGLLAALLAAPLAWCSRRRRRDNVFWLALGVLGVSWCLGLPGIAPLMRLPGLKMLSFNRFTFVTDFAVLALAAGGVDSLWRGGPLRWRWWFWLPAAFLAGTGLWCVQRAVSLPAEIGSWFTAGILKGRSLSEVWAIQSWFARSCIAEAAWCGLGLAGWLILWKRRSRRPGWALVIGMLLPMELLWFAYGRSAQCKPELYYPRIPMLKEIAQSAPGRILGYDCLPAALAQTHGLHDIRGYDAIDPARLMEMLLPAADRGSLLVPYALTQWYRPKMAASPPDALRLPPVLDLLGVRYIIFRGSPPPGIRPAFVGTDYWALVNRRALPRAFVPHRVQAVADDRERLGLLSSPRFDPREVAYIESPVGLPASCRGTAEIIAESPTRVAVSVRMETPGLVVLADMWDLGWRAYAQGTPVPILRTDHALRGVVVSAGSTELEFHYEPAGFHLGLWLAGCAAASLLVWAALLAWRKAPTLGAGGFHSPSL